MRKTIFLGIILSLISTFAFSQRLKTNEVDDFTGAERKITSWETLCLSWSDFVHIRLLNYDGEIGLDLKYMPSAPDPSEYAVEEDAKLMIMLDDGTIITLYNYETVYTEVGGGAIGLVGSALLGVAPSYPIENSDLELLRSQPVKKVRMITSMGYMDFNINGSKKELIQRMLALVTDN